MDEKNIVEKLKKLEGETFYTVKGLPFTYHFLNDHAIVTDRTNYRIGILDFVKALQINPMQLNQISKTVRGPSYVFGILTDERFRKA